MDLPVARVAVDVPLANLDRPFDYAVPAELDATAQPGVRVKVRFAGRLRDGFILDRVAAGDRDDLAPLQRVVSAEPVLRAEVAELVRGVADHYAGSFADVVRAAVPPRHAAAEQATPVVRPAPASGGTDLTLPAYPDGSAYLAALAAGRNPRAAWTVVPTPSPVGSWASGFAEAAAATLAGGRGVLLLVPDARHLAQLTAVLEARFGRGSFATLAADAGPAARYRSFLAASRGSVRLVAGTRAAVFAPVADLGLVSLWDDGNDAYAEPHAPYWHTREVAALRAHQAGAALLLAGHTRTAEVQHLLRRGWLAALQTPPALTRKLAAAVRGSAPDTARDPLASVARLPHDAFAVVRAGLASGPVLVQVPRAGYLPMLACANCRSLARCPKCSQGLRDVAGHGPSCRWCGPVLPAWRCPECRGTRLRSPVVGVARTAEEFGKAFPNTKVLQASADKPLAQVSAEPALVLATPGAAPVAEGGYATAVLLDAELLLGRPDLRAGEEALRRWLAVAALVRPGADGGTVIVVGEPGSREVQALLRLDPVGYAERELSDRAAAGFPPAKKLVTIEGHPAQLAPLASALSLPAEVDVVGPFDLAEVAGEPVARLTLRCPLPQAGALVAAVRALASQRAARKEPPLRVRVDPQVLS